MPHPLLTPELASQVVCRLSSGRSLRSVCRDPDMPDVDTVNLWRRRHPDFAAALEAVRDRAGARSNTGGYRRSRYSEALADALCAALAEGFSLQEICAHPAVPVAAQCVHAWVRKRPGFAARYRAATAPRQTPKGLAIGKGRRTASCAAELKPRILDHLAAGRPLAAIARDPGMPSARVVRRWANKDPAFAQALQQAQRFQLDLLLDEALHRADHGHKLTRSQAAQARALTQRGLTAWAAAVDLGEARAEDFPDPPPRPKADAQRRQILHRERQRMGEVGSGRRAGPRRGRAGSATG